MSDNQPRASVLLATRSSATAKLIGKRLREHYALWQAEDSELAWNLLTEQRALALLICDLELALDRFALLERIRNAGDTRLAATPVLLLLGENDNEMLQESAFRQGASDFINLPFSSTELLARVRLHTNLFQQHALGAPAEAPGATPVNLLRQLSQESFFAARVQQELSFSARHRSPLSLCLLRLDDVKRLVGEFDKSAVISVVQAVARIVQQTMRREDSLCYRGNAEFSVLYPATNGIGAAAGIRRILDKVAGQKLRLGGQPVPVSVSAAIYSAVATDDVGLEQIEKQLAKCLKAAMAQGGNRVVSCIQGDGGGLESIDYVLGRIVAGRAAPSPEQIPSLLARILPLIEHADAALEADYASIARELRQRLGTTGAESKKVSN